MRPLKKSLSLIVIALMVTLTVLVSGGYLWLNSNLGRNWLQTHINAAIPGSLTIGKQRLRILTPGVDLDDVTLLDAQGRALAGFTHLAVRLAWRPLLQRELRVQSLLLQTPWVKLVQDAETGLNLTRALVPPGNATPVPEENNQAALPFNITCQSLELSDGRLVFDAPKDDVHLTAGGIALAANGDLMHRQARLDLQIQRLENTGNGIHPQPAHIHLNAHLDGERLEVPSFQVVSGQTTISLQAATNQLAVDPVVNGQVNIQGELAELKDAFNLQGAYAGRLTGRLDLNGRLSDPAARLDLSLDTGRVAGQPLDQAHFTIALKDRQVSIAPSAWQLADGRLTLQGNINLRDAFGNGFLEPPTHLDAIAYDLALTQTMPDISPWLKSVAAINGGMESRITFTGKGVRPGTATARLNLETRATALLATGMQRPVNATATLAAQLEPDGLTLTRMNLDADGLSLSGSGRYGMKDQALAGDLAVHARQLSRTLAVVGLPSVKGSGEATIHIGGSLAQPEALVKLVASGLHIHAYSLGNVAIDADLAANGRLTLQRLDIQNQDARIIGSGQSRLLADFGGIDPAFANRLDLDIDNATLSRFMDAPPVDGRIDASLRLAGPLTALTGTLDLEGKSLGKSDMAIGNLSARLVLNNGTLRVDALDVANQGSRLSANGKLELFKPGSLSLVKDPGLDLTLRSRQFDPAIFSDQVRGRFDLDGKISGRVSAPVGQFTVDGSAITVSDQPISAIKLGARFENQRLWLDRLEADLTPEERLVAGGSIGLDKTIDLQLMTDGIRLQRIPSLQARLPAEGVLRLGLSAKGSLDDPDIDGQLTVKTIRINDEPIEDIDLTLSVHDQEARLTGNLNFAVDAAYDLRYGDFKGAFTFDHTETGAYFRVLGRPELHGTLDGRITAAGNLNAMADTTVQADLGAITLYWDQKPLVRSDGLVAHLAGGRLSIPPSTLTLLSKGQLQIRAQAQTNGDMDVALDGRIPLAALRLFSDDLADARGSLVLDGRVTGNLERPQVNANLVLERVAMTVPGLQQHLHDLGGQIHLTPTQVRFEGIQGFLDTGSFTLSGSVNHDAFTPTGMDLTLAARSLPVEVPDTLSVLLNSDIRITGKDRRAAAHGEIVLLEGTYYRDVKINLLKMAVSRERAVSPAANPASIPYFDTVDLDIDVNHRQSFLVENNMADLEISPDLSIGGTLAKPILSGRAQVTSGTVTFQRRAFTVKKGIIDFVNPYKTQADIDIESQATIRDWTVTLALEGTLDNLKLKLTSQPSATSSDILSLVLFGRTGSELTGGESGQRTSSQIMAEMLADTFGEDIKRYSGVDILQVETDSTDSNGANDDAADVRVTLGKHLSDRMTVKYAVETTNGTVTQKAIAEYKLLENILVSGFQDSQGVYGSELSFRIEFR